MGERSSSVHRLKFTPHHKKPQKNFTYQTPPTPTKHTEARDALRQALLRFPVILCPLVDKCRNELGSRVPQPWCVGVCAFLGGFVCECVCVFFLFCFREGGGGFWGVIDTTRSRCHGRRRPFAPSNNPHPTNPHTHTPPQGAHHPPPLLRWRRRPAGPPAGGVRRPAPHRRRLRAAELRAVGRGPPGDAALVRRGEGGGGGGGAGLLGGCVWFGVCVCVCMFGERKDGRDCSLHGQRTQRPNKHPTQGYVEEGEEQRRHLFPGSPLIKYARANVLDYGDEFPRLPHDVNPLNPGMLLKGGRMWFVVVRWEWRGGRRFLLLCCEQDRSDKNRIN